MKRIFPSLIALLLIAAMWLPSLVHAQDGGALRPTYLTWDDVPATTPLRHAADARIRWGWENAADVLGPFNETPYQVNDTTTFILGQDERDSEDFVLRYVSDFAYFWFQPDVAVNMSDLQQAGTRFDTEIWQLMNYIYNAHIPAGIDGDHRIHLVHVTDYFPSLAGFFSPDDQCARTICAKSNERDALYLMLDYGPVNTELYFATLAHELQHLIQFHTDGNEYRWLDEGVSQLIEHLNGYTNDPINNDNVRAFLSQPNHTLNYWSIQYGGQAAYYGAGYLFTVYLYERFGLEFIQTLISNPLDGLAAVNHTLKATGQDISLDQLVRDWHVANYLDNPYVGDGRYYYATYGVPTTVIPRTLNFDNGAARQTSIVNQYGAEYLQIADAGQYQLSFNGATTATLLPIEPYSGETMWWSYNGSGMTTSLTRTVDLTSVDSATLKYQVWWQTGDFPGFLHVLVSADGGARWEPLEGKRMAKRSPYGDAPSHHYAGNSGRWVDDSIDLSAYAGQVVQIRFEYMTNNAISGPGFALDDIQIPELNWLDDAESDMGGWTVDGFMRTNDQVNQQWSVQLVTNEEQPRVIELTVVEGHVATMLDIPQGGGVLVISALAPITTFAGEYTLDLQAQ